jgi:hypothetical protein
VFNLLSFLVNTYLGNFEPLYVLLIIPLFVYREVIITIFWWKNWKINFSLKLWNLVSFDSNIIGLTILSPFMQGSGKLWKESLQTFSQLKFNFEIVDFARSAFSLLIAFVFLCFPIWKQKPSKLKLKIVKNDWDMLDW